MGIDAIIKKHQNKVLLHVRRLVPEADAEDVMQDVLVGIWKGYDGFAALASFEHWVEAIAHNQIADYYRKRQRYADLLGKAEGSRIAKPAYNDFEAFEFIRSFPEQYRDILWKHYIDGMTYPEMAGDEELTPDAIRMACRRGIKYIRRHIER